MLLDLHRDNLKNELAKRNFNCYSLSKSVTFLECYRHLNHKKEEFPIASLYTKRYYQFYLPELTTEEKKHHL